MFFKKTALKNFAIYRKTPVLESLFNKVAGLETYNFIQKRLQHRCFPVSIAKFLRTPISKNVYKRLLLLVVIYCIKTRLTFSFILKHKTTLFYLLLFVFIRFIIRCNSISLYVIFCYWLSFIVTRCHTLLLSVTCCHSLPLLVLLVVTRCHSFYHSLSLVVIRCHPLYHSFSLFVIRCITRLSFYKRSRSFESCSYLSSSSLPQ